MAAPAPASSQRAGDTPTAVALARLASGRDPEAWRQVIERHGTAMYHAALRVTRDEHLAADASQEAFLLVRDAARRFAPRGDDAEAAARGWLMRVATTAGLMALRSTRRRRHREQELPAQVAADQLPARSDRMADALEAELARLPSWQREPLLLHIYGGLDYETIAATLGTTTGTARTRVHRALTRLRARLAAHGALSALATVPIVSFNAPPFAATTAWAGLLRSTATAKISAPATVTGASLAKAGLAAAALLATAATLAPFARTRDRPPPPDTTTPTPRSHLASLPVDAWVRMHPTSRGAGAFRPVGWNNTGVYDPVARRVVILDHWGVGDEPDASTSNALIAYDPAADEVSALTVHDPRAPGSVPIVLQAEGCLALAPDQRRIYIADGADRYDAGPPPPTAPRAFDLAAGTWSRVGDDGPSSPTWNHVRGSPAVMTFDAGNRVVVLLKQKDTAYAGTETWLLDPRTSRWTQVPQDRSALSVDVSASGIAYDAKRGLIVTFGGGFQFDRSSATLHAYSVAENRWRTLASCPRAANAPGFAYDSTHDIFLALIGGETWIYDPSADAWSRSADIERGAHQVFQSVTYDPADDAFVFAGGAWGEPNWSLFRFRR